MSEQNGPEPNDELQAHLDPIVGQLELLQGELQSRVDALMAQVEEQKDQLRRVNGMVIAARRTYVKPGPTSKVTRADSSQRPRFSAETRLELLERLRNLTESAYPDLPGSFSAPFVQKRLGLSKDKAGVLLREMHDHGEIRLVGTRRGASGGREARVYVLSDEH